MPAPFPVLPSLPANRPWRLGTTSYVYADDILPNVERLAGRAEDIELVLFESGASANLPSPAVLARLDELRRAHAFTFTVHFPIDRQFGHADPGHRREILRQMLRIVDAVRPLEPHAYIVHPEGLGRDAAPARLAAWQRDMSAGLAQLVAHGLSPRLLAVENLDFPFDWCAPFIEEADLSVCIDVGHLWRYGVDVPSHLRRWLPRTRVVHLHGECAGRDHLSLAATDQARLAACVRLLSAAPATPAASLRTRGADGWRTDEAAAQPPTAGLLFGGVVTLEMFSFEDTASSIDVLRELLS